MAIAAVTRPAREWTGDNGDHPIRNTGHRVEGPP